MRKWAPWLGVFVATLVALAGGAIVGNAGVAPAHVTFKPVVAGTAPESHYTASQIKRGEFLVKFGSCNDCHTPWKYNEELGAVAPDMTRMLSGHPEGAPGPVGKYAPNDMAVIGPTFTSFAMPFGVIYTPNLTPDIDTGTGSWTEEMFINIFRKAKHLGGNGRPILPPMPFPMVATLPDEDLIGIFAYLRSIPPIRNGVPTLNPPQEVQDGIDRFNQGILKLIKNAK